MCQNDSTKEAAVKAAAHSHSEITEKALELASKNGFNIENWRVYHNIDLGVIDLCQVPAESGIVVNYLFVDIEFARHLFHEFSFCEKCGKFREMRTGTMTETQQTMTLKTQCCQSGWKVIWWPELFQGLVMAEDRFEYIGNYLQTRGLIQEAVG